MTTVSLNANADAYVVESSPSLNTNNFTLADRGASGGTSTQRIFINFDVSGIPSNATVSSATLTLETNGGSGAVLNTIERVTGSWTETGVNWSNQPAKTATNAVNFTPSGSSDVTSSITVTTLAQDMVTNGTGGICVRQNDETSSSSSTFYSRATADARQPTLSITYTVVSTFSAASALTGTAVNAGSTLITRMIASGQTGVAAVAGTTAITRMIASAQTGTAAVAGTTVSERFIASAQTGTAALSAAVFTERFQTAALTGNAAVAALAGIERAVAAALAASGLLSGSGALDYPALAGLSASASVAGTTSIIRFIAAPLDGAAATAAAPFVERFKAAGLTGTAAVAAAVFAERFVEGSSTGAAALAGTALAERFPASGIVGAAVVVGTAHHDYLVVAIVESFAWLNDQYTIGLRSGTQPHSHVEVLA